LWGRLFVHRFVVSGPQSEVLLNLVREEMRRYEGKKWKTTAFRVRRSLQEAIIV
jgi:hypothetical protein